MITCPCCKLEFEPSETSATTNRITPLQIIGIYNEYALKHKWQKVVKPGEALKKKLGIAAKELPEADQWHTVMKGLLADTFFSGRESNYKTSIETLIFKSRYMTFFNSGLDAPIVKTLDDLIAEVLS